MLTKSNWIAFVRQHQEDVKACQDEQQKRIQSWNSDETEPPAAGRIQEQLKQKQIALFYFYEGIPITNEDADKIAAEHNYTAKTSGHKLKQLYNYYCKTSERLARPTAETKTTLINKISLFESVVKLLSESNKQKALDEIAILNNMLKEM